MSYIDLRKQFGRRYRYKREESATEKSGDPWLVVMFCRYGHIYPHGGKTLAASVDGHPNVANTLRKLTCCQVWQDGDFGELTVLFDAGNFLEVSRVMRPYRRRMVNLTPEQREALVERLGRARRERSTSPRPG